MELKNGCINHPINNMENKKIILADSLGYIPTMYSDIFKIPNTDMYIHIDDKLIITPTFKNE